MRFSTTVIVVAALSIGEVMAGPTHVHLHRHRNKHAKKDGVDWKDLDWDHMGIDWSEAYAAGQHTSTVAAAPQATSDAPVIFAEATSTTAPPASSTTHAAAATSSAASKSSSPVSLWNSLVGSSNDLTSFGSSAIGSGLEVAAVGNIGSPQGSNIIKVNSAAGYPFTNTFINTSGKSMTVVLWNKAYSNDGTVANAEANLGSCVAASTPALTIALAPGAQQVVAFQDGTLLGWSQAVDAKTPSGAFATTWGEASFKSAGSGYDMSAILNPAGNNYNMAISSAEVSCISDPTQNYWEATDNNPLLPVPVGTSDGSCYVPGSTATLTTKMGGYF